MLTIVYTMILGFSNGYLTSLSYMYGINIAKKEHKGKAGSTISFFQMFGIFLGSLFSMLIVQNLINL